jgi:hypothetical protein
MNGFIILITTMATMIFVSLGLNTDGSYTNTGEFVGEFVSGWKFWPMCTICFHIILLGVNEIMLSTA